MVANKRELQAGPDADIGNILLYAPNTKNETTRNGIDNKCLSNVTTLSFSSRKA